MGRDLCDECEQCLPLLKNSCLRCAYPLAESCSRWAYPIAESASFCAYPTAEPASRCTYPITESDSRSTYSATDPVSRYAHSIKDLVYCEACETLEPPYDTISALYLYQAPIMQLILELKFKHVLANARLLGELLAQKIKTDWYANQPLPDMILPIPLHFSRLKERGFNQAIEIARPIAKAIKRPLAYHFAQRIKPTSAQATLNLAERRQNIKQAFIIRENISNLHIAVIDDVITTGETIREFCKTLRQSNPRRIDVWCCARATNQVTFGK